MDRARRHPVVGLPPAQLPGEEDVGQLRVAVGPDPAEVVRSTEDRPQGAVGQVPAPVGLGAHHHGPPAGRPQGAGQQAGQQEVAQVVDRHRLLEAVGRPAQPGPVDPGVGHQRVQPVVALPEGVGGPPDRAEVGQVQLQDLELRRGDVRADRLPRRPGALPAPAAHHHPVAPADETEGGLPAHAGVRPGDQAEPPVPGRGGLTHPGPIRPRTRRHRSRPPRSAPP